MMQNPPAESSAAVAASSPAAMDVEVTDAQETASPVPKTLLCLIMEAQKKRLKLKQKESEKQSFEKRSPLQNLNALHFHKSNTKIISNLSFAVAPASVEARNGCLRSLHSSNLSFDNSLPSSSTRIYSERKPKSLSKVATNFSVKSFRSKENALPRKPLSEKSKKQQHLCADGRENGRSKTNPMSKTSQISKLSCGRGNSVRVVKKGSEESEGKKLKDEPLFKSSTPAGSSGVRRNVAEESDSRTANGGTGSETTSFFSSSEQAMSDFWDAMSALK